MDSARKGEIALLVLKHRARKEGVRLTSDMQREIGNIAKGIGIPVAETAEFLECIVRELVTEAFAKPIKRA